MEASQIPVVGPVDYLVLGFPAGEQNFTGEAIDELAKLVAAGVIKVLDMMLVAKGEDGSIEGTEIHESDAGDLGRLLDAETDVALLLAEEDIAKVGATLEPGDVAAVLVWENTWAAPFATAVRRAGGELLASGRIPTQALLAAAEAELAREGA
ncbi:DUF6325 family protein [Svornostia abyssi]|uniref:DUF6325 family protein n=1 Tax=Svornostia abyssi TaxID=2898438 RepID=A0ABY5PHQ0_9ACTN|nr:DUF6325 family protein [Parviterribacteraceae bacterium J379]